MGHRPLALAFRWLLLAAIVIGVAWGHAATAQPGQLTVFAAASLKNALDDIERQRQTDTGKEARISYAASSTLAKQIEAGAPADLFISADEDWMDYLAQRGLIDPQSRVDLLSNELVLIAPKDSAVQVAIGPGFPLAQLLADGHLAMGDPASVPAGKYGKAALTALGVWDTVSGRLAAADSVRAALALVARGEAPLGIVYRTDAAVEPGVKIIGLFPDETHPPIVYPMALTRSAPADAAAFAAYLRGATARALFEKQGFTVAEEAR
jgi:molybdate transport system substrate-binding protein